MLGYIISDKEEINVIEHEIQSFDVLHKTDLNIFVIENGVVLYKNDIILNATCDEHIQVLEWFERSGYEIGNYKSKTYAPSFFESVKILEWFKRNGYKIKYSTYAFVEATDDVYYFLIRNINDKRIIKWLKFTHVRPLNFKYKKRYFKGYKKN